MRTTHSKNTTNEKQKQRLAFPTYDEEDILDWDAAIITPPPRPSGTIRVRLIYKGRSKPMPVKKSLGRIGIRHKNLQFDLQ